MTVEMFADGQLTDAQAAELAPGGSQDITLCRPARDELRKGHPSTPRRPGGRRQRGGCRQPRPEGPGAAGDQRGCVPAEGAASCRPDVTLTTEAPAAWRQSQASSPDVDLFVFDGFVPPGAAGPFSLPGGGAAA